MVSQADRELIQNFVTELQPYLETVDSGVDEFRHANPDGVVLGQAIQALGMIRGAGSVLMIDGLVSITDWIIDGIERVQGNPEIEPDEALRRLSGLTGALKDYLHALAQQQDPGSVLNRAQTILDAIPSRTSAIPGSVRIGDQEDLDRLFAHTPARESDDYQAVQENGSATSGHDQPTDRIPVSHSPAAHEEAPAEEPAREDDVLEPGANSDTQEAPAEIDPELREIFIDEADTLLLSFREHARSLAQNPSDSHALDGLRRDAHTLKGAANMTGFTLIGKVSASIEDLMDALIDHEQPAPRDVLELLVVCWKMLRAMRQRLDQVEMFASPADAVIQRAGLLRERVTATAAPASPIGDHDDQVLSVSHATTEGEPEDVVIETPEASSIEVSDEKVSEPEVTAAPSDQLADDTEEDQVVADTVPDEEFWAPVDESEEGGASDAPLQEVPEAWSPESQATATEDQETLAEEPSTEEEQPFWQDSGPAQHAGVGDEDTEVQATAEIDEFFEPVEDAEPVDHEEIAVEASPDWLTGEAAGVDDVETEASDVEYHLEPEPFWALSKEDVRPAEDEIDLSTEVDRDDPFFEPIDGDEFGESSLEGLPEPSEIGIESPASDATDDASPRGFDDFQIDSPVDYPGYEARDDSGITHDTAFVTGELWNEPDEESREAPPQPEYDFTLEMFETFALECVDYLDTLSRAAMELDRRPDAAAPMRDVRRVLHTLKGAASAADFSEISVRCHTLEELLSESDHGDDPDTAFVDELFTAVDEIERLIERRRAELRGSDTARDDQRVDSTTLRIDLGRVDNLLNTVGELVVTRSGLEQRLERLAATLDELSLSASRLQRSSYLLERETQAGDRLSNLLRGDRSNGTTPLLPRETPDDWDTLEMERYTEFDRLIRQLSEVGADVGTAVAEVSAVRGDLDAISERQRRLTTHLQDELMDVRMVPIATVAPRLYRVVRHVANRRGKRVELVVEGGETPFDKLLLEALSEPLLHLLRNAVDHGIEMPDERRRIGKPATGTITIRASREGNEAIIDVRDDGAGIDHTYVLDAARSLGYDVPDNLSRTEALRYLFLPGFSTRADADEVSGRGIGLDIVEQAISGVKGRMSVDSVPGAGTVFSLRLPLQLSVAQAFLVTAGQGRFAIPIANIEYVAEREDMPLTEFGNAVVVEVGDSTVPVVDIAERFGASQVPIMERESGWVMIAEVAGSRWALVVDDLEGQQEVVVKPLGRFLRDQRALMGATILGNGDVALIIDIAQMLDSGATDIGEYPTQLQELDETDTPSPERSRNGSTPTVLIVDDSLSVRRVVGRTLERHGWISKLARDGVEGLEMAEQQDVDVIITDIEMPRMDGFELLTAIRANHHLNELPVIVLTSRSSEKHRSRAYELGANGYIVKPFQEQELISSVSRFIRTKQEQRS